MQLTSRAVVDGAPIDLRYAELSAGGQNVSPDLAWSGAPEGTRSFAVTCYDPDAPTGSGWWHWVGYDIPADSMGLAEGEMAPNSCDNDYGYAGYGGPCPPPGPAHRYVFTVFALDCDLLGMGDKVTNAAVRFSILQHTLAHASLTGFFALPQDARLDAEPEPMPAEVVEEIAKDEVI